MATPKQPAGARSKASAGGGTGTGKAASSKEEQVLDELLDALRAARDGDFSVRLNERRAGTAGQVSKAFNELVERNDHATRELARLARIVGRDGRMGERFSRDLAPQELKEQGELLALRTAELERSNNDLEQFSYVASHDLQEPLRVIAGYLELLNDHLGEQLDEEARSWIDSASASAARMSSMIKDLLTFARAGAGGGDREVVDLDHVVARALESVGASVRDSGGKVHSARPLGRVHAVRLDVERVLQNLLGNALKYRGESAPVVTIDARRTGDDIEVSVCDNGRGVPALDLERVFGRFERLEGEPHLGTGLGLAMCRRLVERGGGRIWMTRNAPAPGVTMHFTLPAAT